MTDVFVLAQETGGGSRQLIEAMVIGLLFLALMSWIGGRMATATDRPWLQRYVAWAFLAKLFGSLTRYWMVTVLYESGDSFAYQVAGEGFANVWRGLVVPVSSAGGQGTAFTEVVTGFLYAIYTPTYLGGFLMFATISFAGQLLFYAAFRRWFGARKQKLYAIAIFFLPSLVFWPSSIGKDALMVFFLGMATYGASRLLSTYKLSSALIIAPGLLLAAGIRPHVAGILAIALVLALLLGKAPAEFKGSPKRPIMLIGAAIAAAVVLTTFSTTFQVGLEADRGQTDISGFLEDVGERTSTGGSQIDGVAISTPSQLPAAFLTVVFRPLIHEGTSIQVLASALEGTAMLVFVVWKLPQMWRNRRLLRRKSYMTMCLFYTGGFVVAFSAILNLGILTRQRVQLLPFFIALLVGLAFPEPEEKRTGRVEPGSIGQPTSAEPAQAQQVLPSDRVDPEEPEPGQ